MIRRLFWVLLTVHCFPLIAAERVSEHDGQVADPVLRLQAIAVPQAQKAAAAASLATGPGATSRAPGIVYRDLLRSGGEGPEMVVIQGARFLMGSPATEQGRSPDEGPQRDVSIRSFALGVTEVTFADYDRCTAARRCKRANDEGWGRGKRPVIEVTWEDAQDYAKWLSEETGKRYRLPTESEWEYAARAGTRTAYGWGEGISHQNANYGTDQCCGGMKQGQDQWTNTSPVKSFAANPFGLYDTAGNVWEWVQDCYLDSYAGAPVDGSPVEEANCEYRVLRGGAWDSEPAWLRSAFRLGDLLVIRSLNVGFRLAADL